MIIRINSKEIESRFLTPIGKITNTYGREYQSPIGRKGKDINNSNIININNHIKRDYKEKDFEKFYMNWIFGLHKFDFIVRICYNRKS